MTQTMKEDLNETAKAQAQADYFANLKTVQQDRLTKNKITATAYNVMLSNVELFFEALNMPKDKPLVWQLIPNDQSQEGKDKFYKMMKLKGLVSQPYRSFTNIIDVFIANVIGSGAFLTINETKANTREAEDITALRAFWLDLDGSPLEPVLEWKYKPHMVIETSPGKYHCYWLIEDMPTGTNSEIAAVFEEAQNLLARRFEGDSSVYDLPRVMRVPGFYHSKPDKETGKIAPFRSHFVYPTTHEEISEKRYPLKYSDFLNTLKDGLSDEDIASTICKHHGADAREEREKFEYDGLNLVAWVKLYGKSFKIIDALEKRSPDKLGKPSDGGRALPECPYEDDDHSPSGETRTVIYQNGNDRKFGFNCYSGHCKDAKRDRLAYVQKMLEDGWLKREDLENEELGGGSIDAMQMAREANNNITPEHITKIIEVALATCTAAELGAVKRELKSRTGYNIGAINDIIREVKNTKNAKAATQYKSVYEKAHTIVMHQMNKKFAKVKYGATSCVLVQEKDGYTFMKSMAFREFYGNDIVEIEGIKIDKVDEWWFAPRSECRRYNKVVFTPHAPNEDDPSPKLHFNMWEGFAVSPIEGDWSLLKKHILDNVCQGNEEYYHWFLSWIAQMVQQPRIKPESSITMYGEKGTGKSKVSYWIKRMCGAHGALISNNKHLTGNFNAHLEKCLFLMNEEASWAGDVQGAGSLKNLITSDTIRVERKGIDTNEVKNYTRIMSTTNHERAIAATGDERREAFFEMGKAQQQNGAYFAPVDEQMKSGGLEAMMFEMMHYDYSDVDLRNPPKTEALAMQVIENFKPREKWLYKTLADGVLRTNLSPQQPIDLLDGRVHLNENKTTRVDKEAVYNAYIDYCDRYKIRAIDREQDNVVFRYLVKHGVKSNTTGRGKTLHRWSDFPPLPDMRTCFTNKTGVAFED